MECVHDNSADNPNNPSAPPQQVHWGEQTLNEMSDVVVQIIPVNKAEIPVLRAYFNRRHNQRLISPIDDSPN